MIEIRRCIENKNNGEIVVLLSIIYFVNFVKPNRCSKYITHCIPHCLNFTYRRLQKDIDTKRNPPRFSHQSNIEHCQGLCEVSGAFSIL